MNIWQGYGMPESSSVLTLLGPDVHRAGGHYPHSAGLPVPGVALRIENEAGQELPPVSRVRSAHAEATS